MLEVTRAVRIDETDLEERFVRASGPGGQNVNKVATAVELRFHFGRSSVLSVDARERLRRLGGTRVTADDVLVIDARRFRTQARNREDARERLVELVRRALVPPKRRRKTRPSRASKEQRLETKRLRADRKRTRRDPGGDD